MNLEDTVLPVIHLNGTSPEQLERDWGAVVNALDQAIEQLAKASPNARGTTTRHPERGSRRSRNTGSKRSSCGRCVTGRRCT